MCNSFYKTFVIKADASKMHLFRRLKGLIYNAESSAFMKMYIAQDPSFLNYITPLK